MHSSGKVGVKLAVPYRHFKQDDMFLIAGKCDTLIRRDKGAGSRLLANARKSWIKKNLV